MPFFKRSPRKNKKYMVRTPSGNIIHFGDTRYQQYKDTTNLKLYKHLDHLDKDRRERYRARASKIIDKQGNLTYKDPNSANYYAYNYLW